MEMGTVLPEKPDSVIYTEHCVTRLNAGKKFKLMK